MQCNQQPKGEKSQHSTEIKSRYPGSAVLGRVLNAFVGKISYFKICLNQTRTSATETWQPCRSLIIHFSFTLTYLASGVNVEWSSKNLTLENLFITPTKNQVGSLPTISILQLARSSPPHEGGLSVGERKSPQVRKYLEPKMLPINRSTRLKRKWFWE